MIPDQLDDLYLNWLYRQVGSVRVTDASRSYWSLCKQLHDKEFFWFVPNDENRAEDGIDLRREFIRENDLYEDDIWMSMGCSMLEFLIGLCRRLAFETENDERYWFKHLLENVGLNRYSDATYNVRAAGRVDHILGRIINREYDPNGNGGLFPLDNTRNDQTEAEIWAQLNEYLIKYD